MRTLSLILLIALSTHGLQAQDTLSSTESYHLFNPTPREKMRGFSIDRPDVTESPMTVDAGHFQFEGDLIKWAGEEQGKGVQTINVMNGLYKMGLTHSWDIHVGVELYNIYQDSEGNTQDKGYGSTTIRLKHNFWGNDGEGETALGVIPYITFTPDNEIVYGVGFPFGYALSNKLGLGLQSQFDFIPAGPDGRDVSFFQTIVIGGPLVGNLDFYVEAFGAWTPGSQIFTANGGLIYNASENVKIDIATNQGLNKESPTRVYLGLSFRI
ncbi:MAG TPA: hypothetical protein VD816_07925 [Ohtaekwangia sp.]|nr:hypothetical protein [Ohtaekwangia sp.]